MFDECPNCGGKLTGRADAQYCSSACKQRAYRFRNSNPTERVSVHMWDLEAWVRHFAVELPEQRRADLIEDIAKLKQRLTKLTEMIGSGTAAKPA